MATLLMVEFVQRFKQMDMSKITSLEAKKLTAKHALLSGFNLQEIEVILDNVFGKSGTHNIIARRSTSNNQTAPVVN